MRKRQQAMRVLPKRRVNSSVLRKPRRQASPVGRGLKKEVGLTPAGIHTLQQTIGNKAVTNLISTSRQKPILQRNLMVTGGEGGAKSLSIEAVYAQLINEAKNIEAYTQFFPFGEQKKRIVSILRIIEAEAKTPISLSDIQEQVVKHLITFDKAYKGAGINWKKTDEPSKQKFLLMVLETYTKSALMRELFHEIVSEEYEISYLDIEAVATRTGKTMIDSFARDTINLGDIEFFPEEPDTETPWESTRGEQLVHILSERRKWAADGGTQGERMYARDARALQSAKATYFKRAHAHATDTHNKYRAEQGQPKQLFETIIEEGVEMGAKAAGFVYEGGDTQIIYLDAEQKPLKKELVPFTLPF